LWVAAAISFVAGLDPFRGQLAGLFLMAFSLTLASVLVGSWVRVRLTGEIRLPARAVAGSEVTMRVVVTNASRHAGYDLEATLERVTAGLTAGRESLRRARLDPGETASFEVSFQALQRGTYMVGPAFVGSTYPLGIVRLGNALGSPQRLLVTPRLHSIRQLDLFSGMRHQPGGLPLASQTGESMEFVGVRDYRQGDSPRKIHWKLWARRGIPVVREYSQEYFSRIGIILDTFAPPDAACFESALECVASVASFLEGSDSIVDFFAAGPELHLLSMGRQLGSLERVLEVLACLQPCSRSPYQSLEGQLQDLLPRLSAVLLVTYAPTPERRAFLQRLGLGGAPLKILAVGAPGRRGGELADHEVHWIDPQGTARDLEIL
jgi:uncharacterized protein (DUF58 family)